MIRVSLAPVKQAPKRSAGSGGRALPPAGGPAAAEASLEAWLDRSSATRGGGFGSVNSEIAGLGVRCAPELILKQDILKSLEGRQ